MEALGRSLRAIMLLFIYGLAHERLEVNAHQKPFSFSTCFSSSYANPETFL